jgi:hypothetical protein
MSADAQEGERLGVGGLPIHGGLTPVDRELAEDLVALFHATATAFAAYAQRMRDAERAAEDEAFATTRASVTNRYATSGRGMVDVDALRRQSGGPVRQP